MLFPNGKRFTTSNNCITRTYFTLNGRNLHDDFELGKAPSAFSPEATYLTNKSIYNEYPDSR
jgi:hypothetical protein